MNWIKLRTDIFDDPAVENMALILQTNTRQIVGQLSDVWSWVGRHTTDGRCPKITPALIDSHLDCPGFAAAMIEEGWLETAEKGVVFPKWERHNSSSAKARALEAEAKSLRRREQKKVSDNCPTKTPETVRPEKRREEKNSITPIVPKGTNATPAPPTQVDHLELSPPETPHAGKKKKGTAGEVDLPDDLSPARREALLLWLRHKAERGQRYKLTGFTALLSRLAPYPDETITAAIHHAISNNWSGIFPDKIPSSPSSPPKTWPQKKEGAGAVAVAPMKASGEPDWDWRSAALAAGYQLPEGVPWQHLAQSLRFDIRQLKGGDR